MTSMLRVVVSLHNPLFTKIEFRQMPKHLLGLVGVNQHHCSINYWKVSRNPEAAKQDQIMTLPPPCFIEDTKLSYVKMQHLLHPSIHLTLISSVVKIKQEKSAFHPETIKTTTTTTKPEWHVKYQLKRSAMVKESLVEHIKWWNTCYILLWKI